MNGEAFYPNNKEPIFASREADPGEIVERNEQTLAQIFYFSQQDKVQQVHDFDGTVGFTERRQMRAFASTVENLAGVKLDFQAVADEMLGKSEREIMTIFKERYDLKPDVEALVALRGENYYRSVVTSPLQPNDFTIKVCSYADQLGHEKPVILSNGRYNIQEGLLNHWGIRGLFGAIYTSDVVKLDLPVVKRKKAFLLDLPGLAKVHPSRVLVFEDSIGMCNFAEENGMTAVYVKHALNKSHRPKSGFQFFCNSLVRPPHA